VTDTPPGPQFVFVDDPIPQRRPDPVARQRLRDWWSTLEPRPVVCGGWVTDDIASRLLSERRA
jgi:hypothetical protein